MLTCHLVMPGRFHQKLLNLLTNFEINLTDGPTIQLHQVPMMKVGNGGKRHISAWEESLLYNIYFQVLFI